MNPVYLYFANIMSLSILLIGPSEGKTNVPTWFYNGISLSKKTFANPASIE